MPAQTEQQHAMVEDVWRTYMMTGSPPDYVPMRWYEAKRFRRLLKYLPKDPRCKICGSPFSGVGSLLTNILGKGPSKLNPKVCDICDRFARRYQGGAEVEMTMLFADVRGSTSLAEHMSISAFSQLINRFYQATTEVMIQSNALIDKLIGDEVAGMYVPGFAGPEHTRQAVEAAQKILLVTGHADPEGPWIPVGAGVHTGRAFVGAVGSSEGVTDITALGDMVNTAARLASQAGPGEVIVSREAFAAAGLDAQLAEERRLQLKGRSEPVDVCVLRVSPA